ncbi:hypothetical protein T05_809 [Trichinella murrelli]|uniref:Uncharacterized protein n=1 Tax=Trichinella murrelli TaxID=144512 RepID=A0A0V0U562_9BILA|nr:hypothetical protein T05_809 [Trichinella murrelli]
MDISRPNANTNNNGLIFTNKRHCCFFSLLQHNGVGKVDIFPHILSRKVFYTSSKSRSVCFRIVSSPCGFIVQWNRLMRFANGTFYSSLGISMANGGSVRQAITHVLGACRLRLVLVIFLQSFFCASGRKSARPALLFLFPFLFCQPVVQANL